MAKTKRYRRKSAKQGELLVYFGKPQYDSPDICYAYGPGTCSGDARLLHNVIGDKRIRLNLGQHPPYLFEPSLLDELEQRGYDLTTLKFSIQKKETICGA